MRLIFFSGILLTASPAALADVDTLECNTAQAIRVRYVSVADSAEWCLLRDGAAQTLKIGDQTVSIRFENRFRSSEETGSAVAMAGRVVLTLDDLPGRSFFVQQMVPKPYNPATNSNWRYTPLWQEFGQLIRIDAGAPREGKAI